MNRFERPMTWRKQPRPSLSENQKAWLTKPGALTHALRKIGPLTLRVIAEYSDGATPEEAQPLGLNTMSPVWIREIVMSVDHVECVVARSVTPLQASHGFWQGMRRLRSRPLADILYDNPEITRSSFELACLNRQTALYRTAYPFTQKSLAELWPHPALLARRSVFSRQNTPLLVTECFLPEFWRISLSK